MQASKIKLGAVYAIRRNGELVRFKPTAVVTRRDHDYGNPHDYTSTVEGRITEGENYEAVVVKPESLLGSYEEHVELVERQRLEKEEKKRKDDAIVARTVRLRDLLYSKLGVGKPEDDRLYAQPFRYSTPDEIEVKHEGIQLLIDYLETH